MASSPPSAIGSWGRLSGALLLLFFVFIISSGGSCHWYYHDDDDCHDDDFDDDDFCDDDDDFRFSAGGGAPPNPAFRLTSYRLVASSHADEHPVRALVDIRGPGLFQSLGAGEYGDAEFALFTQRVLQANETLLGLPAESGELRLADVFYEETFTEVTWQQFAPDSSGEPMAVEGAILVFLLDPVGNLRQIQNSTLLRLTNSESDQPR